MAKYTVLGATGQVGAATANALTGRADVRVAVRDQSKGESWKARGVEVAIVEDVADVEALSRAFEGVDGAFVLVPPAYDSDDMQARAHLVSAAIVEAARSARLPKIVALSSVGSQVSRGTGNILTTYIMEQSLGSLPDVAVGFVRAAGFMENWKALLPLAQQKGILPSFYTPLERAMPMVSTTDIGEACADALLQDWHSTQIWELHGPRDVSSIDVAASFGRVLGRDVQAVAVPESEWPSTLAHMGNSPAAVESWIEMMRAFNDGTLVFEGRGTTRLQGKTTIDDAVQSWADGEKKS